MVDSMQLLRRLAIAAGLAAAGIASSVRASDHLDTPTVATNPRSDIGDLYAWTSPDGRQLNLVMTLVGQSFSDNIEYAFHVDSGERFGAATNATSIACRFSADQTVDCRAGSVDRAKGKADRSEGLWSLDRRFHVFAGRRDDPFFNNVKGTRAAYQRAFATLGSTTPVDAAGCPQFDATTKQAILSEWRHTDGGPAQNLLAGWTPATLVISIDLDVVAKHGRMLAVWATTSSAYGQLDRVGRPLTGNALLALLGTDVVRDKLKEQYNRATPATGAPFVPEIEKSLAVYDGFDGKCGNQLLADEQATDAKRYRALATLLADDRLWVNGASGVCEQFFAVELAHLAGKKPLSSDCGGRTPIESAANIYRSILADGTLTSIDDGLQRDEREHSTSVFPFLAAPAAASDYRE